MPFHTERESIPKKLEGLPFSVELYFEEINGLVGSMSRLFDLDMSGSSKNILAG